MSAELFFTVAVFASVCLIFGLAGLILWACGIEPNEPEYYRYKEMKKAQKRTGLKI